MHDLRTGPAQYEDKKTKSLMMLPCVPPSLYYHPIDPCLASSTDMALIKDKSFKKFAKQYAESEDAFFKE